MQHSSFIIWGLSFVFLAISIFVLIKAKLNPTKNIFTESDFALQEEQRSFRTRYEKYMKSDMWKALKKEALERANYICETCDKKAQAAHHKHYPSDFKKDCLENLQVLCNPCHFQIHREQIERRKKDALFIDSVHSGKQHFRIEVKEAQNNAKYVTITELRADDKGRSDNIKILIFEENIEQFNKSLNRAVKFIRYKRLQKRA